MHRVLFPNFQAYIEQTARFFCLIKFTSPQAECFFSATASYFLVLAKSACYNARTHFIQNSSDDYFYHYHQ